MSPSFLPAIANHTASFAFAVITPSHSRRRLIRRFMLLVFVLILIKIGTLTGRAVQLFQSAQMLPAALSPLTRFPSAYDAATAALGNFYAEVRFLFPIMRLFPNEIAAIPDLATLGLSLAESGRAAIVPAVFEKLKSGPVTILILAQNSDELRATGGFITAAALLRITPNGAVDFRFLNSYAVDNAAMQRLHPAAPPAQALFMGLPQWVFRDSNWSPDFAQSAATAAELYQIDHEETPLLIAAVNLNVLRMLVDALGGLTLAGNATPVDGEGALRAMRAAWNIKPGEVSDAGAKDFLKPFLESLINAAQGSGWAARLRATVAIEKLLDRRDILVYSSDPAIQTIIEQHHWDGRFRAFEGDFWMLVESNIGYNKVNPNTRRAAEYHISLLDPAAPFAETTLRFENVNPPVSCADYAGTGSGSYEQRMIVCYWNLIRLYTPFNARLTAQNIAPIPAQYMPMRRASVGGASLFPESEQRAVIEGLALIPAGETRTVQFAYTLPPSVVRRNADGTLTYRLLVQRQPGQVAYPLTIALDLPPNAAIHSTEPAINGRNGDTVVYALPALDKDLSITLTFKPV